MRNKRTQHIFVYILCSALIVTLGMSFQSADRNHVIAATNSSVHLSSTPQIPSIVEVPANKPENTNSPDHTIPSSETASQRETTEIKEASLAQYETTAYYLNVRANGYAKSKIIDVVKKGTVLEVHSVTKDGWLRLKGGGYVHGGYAKLIAEQVKPAETVKTLSLNVPIAAESIVTPAKANVALIQIAAEAEPDKPTSKVKSNSGLTEQHIAEIFEGTALEGQGLEEAVLEVEEEYGINAYFTIAVMKLESGNGNSRLAKKKNNLFGLNAIDGDAFNRAYSFKTKGDSVRKFGELISKNYVGKGYATIEKVADKYASNPRWPVLVKSIMNSDFKKI